MRTRLTLLAVIVMTLLCAGLGAVIVTSIHNVRTVELNRRNHDANTRAAGLDGYLG
ncbi:hypothetical protein [Nonomuraea sp. NPDC049709]|uniref:hypothetical protein n=1 Tax=Nonomuraea sp. NPDC049709 TaxID=3154736 RepID=UPI003412932C